MAVRAPPDSVVCWWIDYNHDAVKEPGETGCTWTTGGVVTLNLPRFEAYNASIWVARSASRAAPAVLIPGGGLAPLTYGAEGLVVNATLPGGALRVYNGTLVYAEAACTTSITLVDAAGRRMGVTPRGSTIAVRVGSRSATLPCTSGYRVYRARRAS